jgi:hypothetical protein
MIDWNALRGDMPQIVEHLLDMMTEDVLPSMISGPMADVETWPAVEIGYVSRDGEALKVRLSIEPDTREAPRS